MAEAHADGAVLLLGARSEIGLALAGRGEVWVPPVLRPLFAVLRWAPRALWRRMPR